MLENHQRNPFLILVFTFVGMFIRYVFFSLISFVLGNKIKNIWSFSEGFKQIVYNILLTFLIFIIFIFYVIYDIVNK